MPRRRNVNHFRALSDNLASLAPNLSGQVACPICLKLFSESAYEAGLLTDAHILPQSIGGRRVTLVCKECNSLCGARQDADFYRYVQFRCGVKSGTSQKLKVRYAGYTANAKLSFDPSAEPDRGWSLDFAEQNPPAAMEAFAEGIGRASAGAHRTITFIYGYDIRLVKLAMLTSAYLDAFRRLGYWYILNENLDQVRREIQGQDSTDLAVNAWIDWAPTNLRPGFAELYFAIEPEGFRCVVFSFLGRTSVLPIADDRDCGIFRNVKSISSLRESMYLHWPPFQRMAAIPHNVRAGRCTAEDDEGVAILVHPDCATVRRIGGRPPIRRSWVSVAPRWAKD